MSPEGALTRGATVASYVHLGADPAWAAAFVAAARRCGRVVSLAPGATEAAAVILDDAAAAEVAAAAVHDKDDGGAHARAVVARHRARLVGVSGHCGWPPWVTDRPRLTAPVVPSVGRPSADVEADMAAVRAAASAAGKAEEAGQTGEAAVGGRGGAPRFHTVDAPRLRSLWPAVVFTQDACDVCDVTAATATEAVGGGGGTGGGGGNSGDSFEAPPPPKVLSLSPVTVDGVLDVLSTVGAALSLPAAAARVRACLAARLATVAAVVAGRPPPRVAGVESVAPLVAAGQWAPDVRARAGGVDALGDQPGQRPRRIGWAAVAAARPDVLLFAACGRTAAAAAAGDVRAALAAHPALWATPALAARPPRAYVVDAAPLAVPGPRLVDAVELTASLLHPGVDLGADAAAACRRWAVLRVVVTAEAPGGGGAPRV